MILEEAMMQREADLSSDEKCGDKKKRDKNVANAFLAFIKSSRISFKCPFAKTTKKVPDD